MTPSHEAGSPLWDAEPVCLLQCPCGYIKDACVFAYASAGARMRVCVRACMLSTCLGVRVHVRARARFRVRSEHAHSTFSEYQVLLCKVALRMRVVKGAFDRSVVGTVVCAKVKDSTVVRPSQTRSARYLRANFPCGQISPACNSPQTHIRTQCAVQ